MDYVINKRIIHLQKDGKRLCHLNGRYGNWPYRVATDEEVAKYHLCGTCRKASKKFDDSPDLAIKVPLTQDDLSLLRAALTALDSECDKGDGDTLIRNEGYPLPDFGTVSEEEYTAAYDKFVVDRRELWKKLQ